MKNYYKLYKEGKMTLPEAYSYSEIGVESMKSDIAVAERKALLTAYRDLRQAVIYDYMKQKGYSRIKGKKGFEKKEITE